MRRPNRSNQTARARRIFDEEHGEQPTKPFRGWHARGYLPHCDKPGLIQFITFRLWDSMPASRRGEWEHLMAVAERSDGPRSSAPAGARSLASPDGEARAEAHQNAAREQHLLS